MRVPCTYRDWDDELEAHIIGFASQSDSNGEVHPVAIIERTDGLLVAYRIDGTDIKCKPDSKAPIAR